MLQRFTGHKTASQVARYVHSEHLQTAAIVGQLPRFGMGDHEGKWTAGWTAENGGNGQAVTGSGTNENTQDLDQTPLGLTDKDLRQAVAEKGTQGGKLGKYPLGESNPCFQDENLMS